eukprot:COSAG02_NODE_316_length_24889_cov_9.418556_3_plen_318_part_00
MRDDGASLAPRLRRRLLATTCPSEHQRSILYMVRVTPGLLIMLSCSLQGARARDPNTTVLNEWPMIMVHDAATTYLREGHLLNKTVLDWTITQPPVGTAGELNCGARGFDWRPTLLDGGKLVMHHGSVTIDYPMEGAIDEIVSWCANNTQPEDLVVLGVTDCSGSGCAAAVQKLLAVRSIKWVTDCTDLKGLTVAAARAKYELPGGGYMMAIFDCWNENYVPANACSGYGGKVAERNSALTYSCYASSKTKAFPIKRMMDYLDKVGNTPPDATGRLSTAQALWEETTESTPATFFRCYRATCDSQRYQTSMDHGWKV